MEYLDRVTEDGVAHIRLNHGRSNPMNVGMMRELQQVLQELDKDAGVRGLLLHGKPDYFSSGLDLIDLYERDADGVREVWVEFVALSTRFVAFSKPSIAAISGHSPAGGCVLALCCDYRVMVDGDYTIGLNELPVGIVVPEAVFHLYAFWLGKANAYRNLLEGTLLSPHEALQVGLVDQVVPVDRLVTTAMDQMRRFMRFDSLSWRLSKTNLRRELSQHFQQDHSEDIDALLERWWAPSTRANLKMIIDNITSTKQHAKD